MRNQLDISMWLNRKKLNASTNTEAKKLLDDLMKVQPQSEMNSRLKAKKGSPFANKRMRLPFFAKAVMHLSVLKAGLVAVSQQCRTFS